MDKLSSAHVYLRLPKVEWTKIALNCYAGFIIDIAKWRDMIYACFFQGQTINDIPPEVLIDCAQLVKNNSIQGKDVHLIMFYIEQG